MNSFLSRTSDTINVFLLKHFNSSAIIPGHTPHDVLFTIKAGSGAHAEELEVFIPSGDIENIQVRPRKGGQTRSMRLTELDDLMALESTGIIARPRISPSITDTAGIFRNQIHEFSKEKSTVTYDTENWWQLYATGERTKPFAPMHGDLETVEKLLTQGMTATQLETHQKRLDPNDPLYSSSYAEMMNQRITESQRQQAQNIVYQHGSTRATKKGLQTSGDTVIGHGKVVSYTYADDLSIVGKTGISIDAVANNLRKMQVETLKNNVLDRAYELSQSGHKNPFGQLLDDFRETGNIGQSRHIGADAQKDGVSGYASFTHTERGQTIASGNIDKTVKARNIQVEFDQFIKRASKPIQFSGASQFMDSSFVDFVADRILDEQASSENSYGIAQEELVAERIHQKTLKNPQKKVSIDKEIENMLLDQASPEYIDEATRIQRAGEVQDRLIRGQTDDYRQKIRADLDAKLKRTFTASQTATGGKQNEKLGAMLFSLYEEKIPVIGRDQVAEGVLGHISHTGSSDTSALYKMTNMARKVNTISPEAFKKGMALSAVFDSDAFRLSTASRKNLFASMVDYDMKVHDIPETDSQFSSTMKFAGSFLAGSATVYAFNYVRGQVDDTRSREVDFSKLADRYKKIADNGGQQVVKPFYLVAASLGLAGALHAMDRLPEKKLSDMISPIVQKTLSRVSEFQKAPTTASALSVVGKIFKDGLDGISQTAESKMVYLINKFTIGHREYKAHFDDKLSKKMFGAGLIGAALFAGAASFFASKGEEEYRASEAANMPKYNKEVLGNSGKPTVREQQAPLINLLENKPEMGLNEQLDTSDNRTRSVLNVPNVEFLRRPRGRGQQRENPIEQEKIRLENQDALEKQALMASRQKSMDAFRRTDQSLMQSEMNGGRYR